MTETLRQRLTMYAIEASRHRPRSSNHTRS